MDSQHPLIQYFSAASIDVLRLSIWLMLLMLVFAPLEKLFSLHRQALFRRGFATDLGYFFINGLLPKLAIAPLLAILAFVLQSITPDFIPRWSAGLPDIARIFALLVVSELGFYWGHRWMHEVPFLWRFHAIHHSAEQMDWLVNTRAHPVDMIFPRICGFIPTIFLGLARPLGQTTDWPTLIAIFIGVFWGFFIHANLRWRFGWLERLIATPAFHHWHHTNDGPACVNKNYAAMLPWIDWLFGTLLLPSSLPGRYGCDTRMAPRLAAQLLQPFTMPKADGIPAKQ